MKRKIRDIMNEMDKIEKVEIPSDLLDELQDYFKEEIESEKKSDDEKAARGISDNNVRDEGYGEQDRI